MADLKVNYRIYADVRNENVSKIVAKTKQEDTLTRYLDITVTDNGVPVDLTGCEVRIYGRKYDKTEFYNEGILQEAVTGRCLFEATTQMTACPAHSVHCEIRIFKNNEQILSTMPFEIFVVESLIGESAIESSNEYGALVLLYQNLYESIDLMQKMVATIGLPGEIATGYGLDTMWKTWEHLVAYMEGDFTDLVEEVIANAGGNSEEGFTIIGMLSDDASLNEWAFRQKKIGDVLNKAFELNSEALADCETVAEISASSAALAAIGTNVNAMKVCAKHRTLAASFIEYAPDELVLQMGLGYLRYNVGDLVTLDMYGVPTPFRVAHKDYKTTNKIVLVAENAITSNVWHTSNVNSYSSCSMRTYLNDNVLAGFSEEIQDAIVTTAVACHNKATAKTCNDKIWLLSYAEVGLGTNSNAPAEGSVLSYFSTGGQTSRIKTLNGEAVIWWLRTPISNGDTSAWYVKADGSANYNNCSGTYGVVPAFEI